MIKNIIFDLGAVVIDIDPNLTYNAFSTLTNVSPAEIKNKLYETDLWNKHETGAVSDAEIREAIKTIAQTNLSDNQIDEAWNSLLIDIPKSRVDRIVELSKKYRIFVLSNTNAIHAKYFNNLLFVNAGIDNLSRIFEKVYYSHEIGLRKPNPEIYQHVLEKSKLAANETLFLDDNFDNIVAAKSVGIEAIQVISPLTMLDYLKPY